MSFNIVDLVKDQISDQLMGSMGNALGMQGAQTSSALSGALPGLLGGLMNSAGTSAGAGALFDAVQKQDDGMLGNIGNLLGGNQSTSLANQGTSVLTSLLGGGAIGKLAGVVAKAAGISGGNSSSLLGMLAPIVLGVLKKKIFDGGMNASSMASMLSGQKDNIHAAMPQGFADQLQSEGFFDSIASQSGTTAASPEPVINQPNAPASSGGGGILKWLLPLIAIAVLGWLAIQYFGGNKAEEAANATQDAVSNAADSASAMSEDAMQAARDAMPEGVDFDNISDGINGIFGSTTDALSGITDVESATAAIPSIEQASEKLGGISDVIARLPDAAKGPIGSIVNSGLSGLQPLIEKVTAIPGVGDLIEPIITPMMEMLQGLAG